MSATTFARPYARAVFATARAADALESFSTMLALATGLVADPQLSRLLSDPRLSRTRRVEALCSIAGDRFDDTMRRLLSLLGERGRLALLPEIEAQFEQLRADAERRATAWAVSARELEEGEAEKIRRVLAERTGCTVVLESRIDEQLLGGAVVRVGDQVLDGSLRGRLARLAQGLAGHQSE